LLQTFPWPGNVRQLEHCIHRALIFTRGYPIQAADLPLAAEQVRQSAGGSVTAPDELRQLVRRYLGTYTGQRAHEEFLDRAERLLIAEALERAGDNQTHAARLLGLPRPTLHAKMQKHRLRMENDRPSGK